MSRRATVLVNLWAGRWRKVAEELGANENLLLAVGGSHWSIVGNSASFRARKTELSLLLQSPPFLSLSLHLCDVGITSQGCHVELLRGSIHGVAGRRGSESK